MLPDTQHGIYTMFITDGSLLVEQIVTDTNHKRFCQDRVVVKDEWVHLQQCVQRNATVSHD